MISVLIPTCHRPELLREMLKTLRATTDGWELEIISVIDEDQESVKIAALYEADVIDFCPVRRGALWAWNRALRLSDGDIIVPAGDDQIFHDKWLEYAIESHENRLKGYGVVGMNDLAYNGDTQVATMLLFDRQFCIDVMGGVFAPPCYKYLCVDLEWNEKSKMLGKFYWEERAVVEHLHSAHGKREYDLHDKWKDENDLAEIDGKIYEERKSRGFPIEWERLI